jgi:hypothetical protein
VLASVTRGTQSDQVLLDVATELTSCFNVMYLQVTTSSTRLTTPSIAPQNSQAQFLIEFEIELLSPSLWEGQIQAVAPNSSITCRLWLVGSNPIRRCTDKRRAFGSPSCKLAPARKSAQIISKQ